MNVLLGVGTAIRNQIKIIKQPYYVGVMNEVCKISDESAVVIA